MTDYKMIYKDQVFNVLYILPTLGQKDENGAREVESIEATYIDESGEIKSIEDKACFFRFLRR